MKASIGFGCLLLGCASAHAQSCEGGLFLNPQVIRGEGSAQTDSALKELIEFLRPSGLPVSPVLNVRETQDVLDAIKRPVSPCWVYGNPVVGLASGFRPIAINIEPIQSAVLILSDIGAARDAAPVELAKLPAQAQARVLAKLKTVNCFGMKSGVTTALVQSEKLCGNVTEVLPQQGLGQSYLPTKAAFYWQADRWAGLITRLQTAQSTTMKNHHGTDERIHLAQLVIVSAKQPSWGYGIYVHPKIPADVAKRAASLFTGLNTTNVSLLRTLDLGSKYAFSVPDEATVQAMRTTLAMAP